MRSPATHSTQLKFRRAPHEIEAPVARFFAHLRETGEDARSHRHPFTYDSARERCAYDCRPRSARGRLPPGLLRAARGVSVPVAVVYDR